MDRLIHTEKTFALAKCRECKRAGRIDFILTTETTAYMGRPSHTSYIEIDGNTVYLSAQNPLDRFLFRYAIHDCDPRKLKVNTVRGIYVADKPCDGRCMGAVGPMCSCSCGGKNHGAKFSSW